MDFQQAGIADTQRLICRIDVHNGFIARAVIEPGDGMRRHRSAGGSQCQEGKCAESRYIDPVRPRFKIGDGVELGRIGIRYGQINETVVSIAACEMVRPKSTDDGIVAIISVDRIISRASVDRVIAGARVDNVTLTGAVEGVITGPSIDYLALVTSSRDAVASRSPIDVRRMGYYRRTRGQVVEIVGVSVAGAVDGDRHHLYGAIYGGDR